MKTAENLVLNLEGDDHGELGSLLDLERMVLERLLGTGFRQVDCHRRSSRRLHSQGQDDADAGVARVRDIGAATETQRLLVSLQGLISGIYGALLVSWSCFMLLLNLWRSMLPRFLASCGTPNIGSCRVGCRRVWGRGRSGDITSSVRALINHEVQSLSQLICQVAARRVRQTPVWASVPDHGNVADGVRDGVIARLADVKKWEDKDE
jgi:hypothetical protein